jgi:putative acetyltransferase
VAVDAADAVDAVDAVVVRRATTGDAAAAATIVGDALAEYGLPFEPEGRDADVATFGAKPENDDFVAVDSATGQALGLASIGPQGTRGVGWVSKVFVAKSARRRGVGRALMSAVDEAARARGYREVGLRTRVVFREAIAMYEAHGYARRESESEGEGGAAAAAAAAAAVIASGDVVYYRAV